MPCPPAQTPEKLFAVVSYPFSRRVLWENAQLTILQVHSIVVRTRAHFFVMRRESGLRVPEFSDTPVEFVRFGRSAQKK